MIFKFKSVIGTGWGYFLKIEKEINKNLKNKMYPIENCAIIL